MIQIDYANTKTLVIAECQRITELLQDGNLSHDMWRRNADLSELRRKMRELRRDTVRLEKMLYTTTGR